MSFWFNCHEQQNIHTIHKQPNSNDFRKNRRTFPGTTKRAIFHSTIFPVDRSLVVCIFTTTVVCRSNRQSPITAFRISGSSRYSSFVLSLYLWLHTCTLLNCNHIHRENGWVDKTVDQCRIMLRIKSIGHFEVGLSLWSERNQTSNSRLDVRRCVF